MQAEIGRNENRIAYKEFIPPFPSPHRSAARINASLSRYGAPSTTVATFPQKWTSGCHDSSITAPTASPAQDLDGIDSTIPVAKNIRIMSSKARASALS